MKLANYERDSSEAVTSQIKMSQTFTSGGNIRCAELCRKLDGRSFTYDKKNKSCTIYSDESGVFDFLK